MIGFASPAWLLGLLLAPLLWWLHRSGPLLRRVPVASLDLWRDAAASAEQAGPRRRADPAWLRRAAIAALLSLALAAPQWMQPAPPVTVWIDDSLSMRATDASGTRLERGAALVQQALPEAGSRDVSARRLSDPTGDHDGPDAAVAAALRDSADAVEPRLPPPDALDPSRAHWLVTDGADASVNAWAATAPIARVLQVSGPTRNVGITRISARLLPGATDQLAVQVRLLNGGDTSESRTVEVFAGSSPQGPRNVALEAGAAATLDVTVAAATARVRVRLLDGDALPADDVLELDLAPLERLPVAVDAACGATVARAVRAHPALRTAAASAARLSIDCGGGMTSDSAARLRFARGAPAALERDALLWPASAEPLRRRIGAQLPPGARGVLAPAAAGDVTLLASGTAPLIVVRGGMPRTVETSLDLEAGGFASGPGAPLVLAALVDVAADAGLLDRIASVDRGDDASRIVPTAGVIALRPVEPARAGVAVSLMPLLLVALTLLAWDLVALLRRLLRERAGPRGIAP